MCLSSVYSIKQFSKLIVPAYTIPAMYESSSCSTFSSTPGTTGPFNFRHSCELKESPVKIVILGTSLVAQWLRIRLPMQGTRVQALVREDPTCRRATKPVRHNY